MKLLSTGEAKTDGPCPICKTEHRLISDEDRELMTRLGFTEDEIEDSAKDLEKRYAHLERGSPDFHVKPSGTKEAVRERVKRHRDKRRKGGE